MKWVLASIALAGVLAAIFAGPAPIPQSVDPDLELLGLFGPEVSGILFADIADLRAMGILNRLREAQAGVSIPSSVGEFSAATGVDPFNDIDQVLIGHTDPNEILAAIRVRYVADGVEQYLENRQAPSETYAESVIYRPNTDEPWAVAFEEDLVLVGSSVDVVRAALERAASGRRAMEDMPLMTSIEAIESGNQIWAVGTFEGPLVPEGFAPPMATDLVESLQSGTYQMQFDPEEVRARASGQFGTDEAAQRAGDLLRGLVALGKMGAAEEPDLLALLDGFRVENVEGAIQVHFTARQELLDRIAASRLETPPTD